MRIAVMVIALCLVLIIGAQSCAVGVGSSMLGDKATSDAGAFGVLLAFLFVLGAAFVLRAPGVSAAIFIGGGVLALGAGSAGAFKDLLVWGVLSIVLGIMALFGRRELAQPLSTIIYPPSIPLSPHATQTTPLLPDGSPAPYAGAPMPYIVQQPQRSSAASWIMLGVALTVGLAALALFGGGFVQLETVPVNAQGDQPGGAVMTATADEIEAAYSSNEVAAQLKYGDRTLDVTGTITSITLDASNEPVLTLVGPERSGDLRIGVRAHFSADWAPQIGSMAAGQTVVVRCTKVSEILGAALLDECAVPPLAANQFELASDSETSGTDKPEADIASSSASEVEWQIFRQADGSSSAALGYADGDWFVKVSCSRGLSHWQVDMLPLPSNDAYIGLNGRVENVVVQQEPNRGDENVLVTFDVPLSLFDDMTNDETTFTVGSQGSFKIGREVHNVIDSCPRQQSSSSTPNYGVEPPLPVEVAVNR